MMGLDITAYKNVEFLEELPDVEAFEEKYDWRKNFDFIHSYQDFPDRLPPIKINSVYRYQDKFGFQAGSYSGYNWWREELCKMALGVAPVTVWKNWHTYRGTPFAELIYFSDCEGILGTEVCQKLLGDFRTFKNKANEHPESWFIEAYNLWLKAFEYAADNGYVDFH